MARFIEPLSFFLFFSPSAVVFRLFFNPGQQPNTWNIIIAPSQERLPTVLRICFFFFFLHSMHFSFLRNRKSNFPNSSIPLCCVPLFRYLTEMKIIYSSSLIFTGLPFSWTLWTHFNLICHVPVLYWPVVKKKNAISQRWPSFFALASFRVFLLIIIIVGFETVEQQ